MRGMRKECNAMSKREDEALIEEIIKSGLELDSAKCFRDFRVHKNIVMQNGLAIQFLKDFQRTNVICFEAVKQNPYAKKFLTEEQIEEANNAGYIIP